MSKINQDPAKRQGKKKRVIIKKDLWGRGLPKELLELILSKLIFVVDINNFHSVCKTWRSITVSVSPPRQLINPFPLRYADSSFPLLFQITDDWGDRSRKRKYRLFHPLYKYTWNMEFPPQVRDDCKRIYFSKYGWSLIMYDSDIYDYPFLFNPLTQEIKELPSMPVFPGYSPCMFFTCPPSHSDCFVVAIAGRHSSIYVHKLGEDDWKKHDLKGKMDPSFKPFCHPILYQGLCYCLNLDGNLAEFDIRDIENTWIVHKTPMTSRKRGIASALVEHNGQLLAAFITWGRSYILKLDMETKSCVRMQYLENLENNALFISEGASFSQRAAVSGTGNKIFCPFELKNKTDHSSVQFFSLATGKYHSFFDNLSSESLYDMEYLLDLDSSWLPICN